MLGMVLICLVYFGFYLMSFKKFYGMESLSTYECGFSVSDDTRNYFSFRFFFIAILFLVFDVEIALMLPLPFIIGDKGLFFFIFFIWVLIVGLVYEYWYGSLSWL